MIKTNWKRAHHAKWQKGRKRKLGFNITVFPGGPPPQYLPDSNRVNFGVRMRTGALRLIWSNPFTQWSAVKLGVKLSSSSSRFPSVDRIRDSRPLRRVQAGGHIGGQFCPLRLKVIPNMTLPMSLPQSKTTARARASRLNPTSAQDSATPN